MSLPKIHCQAVRVPVLPFGRFPSNYAAEDLVPGADPYIAALLGRLEADVRAQHAQEQVARHKNRMTAPRVEVSPPLPGEHIEFQPPGEGPWFWWEGR